MEKLLHSPILKFPLFFLESLQKKMPGISKLIDDKAFPSINQENVIFDRVRGRYIAKNSKQCPQTWLNPALTFFLQIGAFLLLSKFLYSILISFWSLWNFYAFYQDSKCFCANFENFWGDVLFMLCNPWNSTPIFWKQCPPETGAHLRKYLPLRALN